jgi:hypothetical protein
VIAVSGLFGLVFLLPFAGALAPVLPLLLAGII